MPLFPANNDTFDITLDCDPSEGTAADPKSVFTVRPLNYVQVAEAKSAAGIIPWHGRKIADSVSFAGLKAHMAKALELRPDLKDLPIDKLHDALTGSEKSLVGIAHQEATNEAHAALTDEDLAAVTQAEQWMHRHHMEVAKRGTVKVNGESAGIEALVLSIQPASLALKVLVELAKKITDLSELPAEGKAESAPQSGSTATTSGKDGSANTATSTQPS